MRFVLVDESGGDEIYHLTRPDGSICATLYNTNAKDLTTWTYRVWNHQQVPLCVENTGGFDQAKKELIEYLESRLPHDHLSYLAHLLKNATHELFVARQALVKAQKRHRLAADTLKKTIPA